MLDIAVVHRTQTELLDKANQSLHATITDSPRCPIIAARLQTQLANSSPKPQLYLSLECRDHRIAICRLLIADHPFLVEQARRAPHHIPRDQHTCRFCHHYAPEDEVQVLLSCNESLELRKLRLTFLAKLLTACPKFRPPAARPMTVALLCDFLTTSESLPLFAKYVFTVSALCNTL